MDIHNVKFTAQEQNQIERCYSILDEEQILQCEEEAIEIAMRESQQEDAAELLVSTWVRAILRNSRSRRGASR